MKRTFIACPLSKEFLSSYETDITPLLLQEKSIKAVSAENMHITLKFLGDTEDRLCPEIASALGRDLAHVRSCGLFFSGFGAFPDMKNARILWLGCDDGKKEMMSIAGRIDTALQDFGFEKESRVFRPHVTIGRARRGQALNGLPELKRKIEEKMYIEKVKIDMITFFESVLTPQGPVYKALEQFPLKDH